MPSLQRCSDLQPFVRPSHVTCDLVRGADRPLSGSEGGGLGRDVHAGTRSSASGLYASSTSCELGGAADSADGLRGGENKILRGERKKDQSGTRHVRMEKARAYRTCVAVRWAYRQRDTAARVAGTGNERESGLMMLVGCSRVI